MSKRNRPAKTETGIEEPEVEDDVPVEEAQDSGVLPTEAPPAVKGIESAAALGVPSIVQTPPRGLVLSSNDPELPEPGQASLDASGELAEPILPPPSDAAPRAPVFVVENPNTVTVGWGGIEVRLAPGSEISEDSYGDGAIERFRTAGVKLREKFPAAPPPAQE
jgi:hypothetical protein